MKSTKIRMLVAATLTLLLYGAEAFAKTSVSQNVPAVNQSVSLSK
ncbi:MAG TPA: hypothetical protein V6C76_18015 [Drouetiella sp.]